MEPMTPPLEQNPDSDNRAGPPASRRLQDAPELAALLLIVVALSLGTLLHSVAKMLLVDRNFSDFANYYFFAQELNRGTNVYALSGAELAALKESSSIDKIAGKAEYAPLFFLLMSPFNRLPFWQANFLWLLLNLLALAFCLWLSLQVVAPRSVTKVFALALGTVVCCASQPLMESIGIGQINLLILLLLLLMVRLQQHGGPQVVSGVLMAIVLLLKPQFGLLFVYFLLTRRLRLCLSACVAYAAFHAIGAIVYGLPVELSYWHRLLHGLPHASGAPVVMNRAMNISLLAFGARVSHGLPIQPYVAPAVGIVSLALCVCALRRSLRTPEPAIVRAYSLMVLTALIVSPLTEEHHMVFAALPMLVLIAERRASLPWLVLACVLVNLRYSFASFSRFEVGPLSVFSFGKLYGLLILWYLLHRTMAESRHKEDLHQRAGAEPADARAALRVVD